MIDTLHIILPGLFHCAGDDVDDNHQYPSLVKLLSKATVVPTRTTAFEGVLKNHFAGMPCREIPAGALSALAHGAAQMDDKTTWMRADPVYLKTDAHGLYCLGNQHIQINQEEVTALADSLNEYFSEDGLKVYPLKDKTWVLSMSDRPDMATNALADVEGKCISKMLPSGPDAAIWHKRINECQMILNQHPVNIERQKKGVLPVNSLWFWGLGRLPEKIISSFDCIYSANKIMRGLSMVANTPCYEQLDGFHDLLDKMSQSQFKTGAVIDSRLKRANNLTNHAQRETLLSAYEQNWFTPIESALMDGKIKSLFVDACDGRRFLISKRHFKYFWRRNQNFVSMKP